MFLSLHGNKYPLNRIHHHHHHHHVRFGQGNGTSMLSFMHIFNNKIKLNTARLHVPAKTIRDQSVFVAVPCAKAINAARCVTAPNAVSRTIDSFNHDCKSPKNIIKSHTILFQFLYTFYLFHASYYQSLPTFSVH